MSPRLESVAITDFRSIKGTVTLPLGAPVVLIHGANGTGKTSVLSAIEMALTGEVLALRRSDANYFYHLPHRESTEARIVLSTSNGSADARPTTVNMTVTAKGPQTAPLFNDSRRRFFAERCYLAQSTLGRLLEIYQHADVNETESPLTRFVKDVLGLDQLDSVIAGLYAADDVRRIRKLVPAFRDTEDARTAATKRLTDWTSLAKKLQDQLRVSENALREVIRSLPEFDGSDMTSIAQDRLISTLESDQEERELVSFASARRELTSLRSGWAAVSASPEAEQRVVAEDEERTARVAVANWRDSAGQRLELVIEDLRSIFPNLPSLASTDPQTAIATATERVVSELRRCNDLLAQDDLATTQLATVDQDLERGRARIAVIDAQISELAGDAAGLSQALAAIVPHVHGEECPVCGRDYSEVSKEPLVVRLSAQVSRLTEQGDRLQALAKARSETVRTVTKSERERDSILQRRLAQETRVSLKARAASLTESSRRLDQLKELASSGSSILRRDAQARGRLAQLRERDQRATEIRATLGRLCKALDQPELGESEPVPEALARLEMHMKARESQLLGVQSRRRSALKEYRNLQSLQQQSREAQGHIDQDRSTFQKLSDAFEAAEYRRLEAKKIGAAAKRARAGIVRRVFNDSLNAVWRDLFVRLAPTEPFVPAFKLPETPDGPVVAALETVHRSGAKGGTPGAMLSAGNLNTAALTLFLALHLSVSVQLPWLILDDPVQSMDEVHVSQFAALLRALSKNHGRQIVIAVHDRALFDYLALELSPAFPDDQLLTLELGRSDSGASLAEPVFRLWQPEKALAAG